MYVGEDTLSSPFGYLHLAVTFEAYPWVRPTFLTPLADSNCVRTLAEILHVTVYRQPTFLTGRAAYGDMLIIRPVKSFQDNIITFIRTPGA